MSNETRHDSGQADFEQQDLSLRPIFIALIGLAVVCLVVAALVAGVYKGMDRAANGEDPAPNPLVSKTVPDPRYATKQDFQNEIKAEFPEPRLEEDERGQLNDFRTQQDQWLDSYGAVDGKPGVVHIPITRAMELVAQRGSPVAPRGGAAVGENNTKTAK